MYILVVCVICPPLHPLQLAQEVADYMKRFPERDPGWVLVEAAMYESRAHLVQPIITTYSLPLDGEAAQVALCNAAYRNNRDAIKALLDAGVSPHSTSGGESLTPSTRDNIREDLCLGF